MIKTKIIFSLIFTFLGVWGIYMCIDLDKRYPETHGIFILNSIGLGLLVVILTVSEWMKVVPEETDPGNEENNEH